jgi:alpha/beta superfamily hydrolase
MGGAGEPVAIPTDEGFALEGILDGAGARGVVVCHPHPAFGGTMDTPLVARLAAALAGAGLRALRFHFRGTGRSGGRPEGGLVEHRDVAAASRFLVERLGREGGEPKVAIAGYSFGALMALRAIARGLAVRAFCGIGLPSTIVGDDRERVAEVEAGLGAAPALLFAGTADQFCELERVRAWAGPARVVALDGEGHFFAGAALDDVVRRAVDFLREA